MRAVFHISSSAFTILLIIVLLGACVERSFYEKTSRVDPNGWDINDSVEFVVEVADTITPMNFIFSIRHNTDYDYSNIYFFINTIYPNHQHSRDTIQVLLAGKDGKWFGKGFGKLKEVEVMLKDGVVFPMKGTYRFSFIHAMRVESLPGVEDLGMRLEKAGE